MVDVAEKYGNAAPKTVEQDSDEVENLEASVSIPLLNMSVKNYH